MKFYAIQDFDNIIGYYLNEADAKTGLAQRIQDHTPSRGRDYCEANYRVKEVELEDKEQGVIWSVEECSPEGCWSHGYYTTISSALARRDTLAEKNKLSMHKRLHAYEIDRIDLDRPIFND